MTDVLVIGPPMGIKIGAIEALAKLCDALDEGDGITYKQVVSATCFVAGRIEEFLIGRGAPAWYARGVANGVAEIGADFLAFALTEAPEETKGD